VEAPVSAVDAQQAAERRAELAYARDALSNSAAGGMITAEQLVDRWTDSGPRESIGDMAAADRTWTFGHVVVDEAQELSPMAWRVIMRRVPSRSLTVVGDLAQTGSLSGPRSWGEVFDRYAKGSWTVEELTVNYRTPRTVMDLATRVLTAAGIVTRPSKSAREGSSPPAQLRLTRGDVPALAAAIRAELLGVEGGTLAVIVPDADRGWALAAADGLEGARVLDVYAVKGLEFDGVVLVEPSDILRAGPRGPSDLYVALTRPTQRLLVVHSGELPDGMDGLADASAS
jgi:superfamily I DNA/RNA helicase